MAVAALVVTWAAVAAKAAAAMEAADGGVANIEAGTAVSRREMCTRC